MKTTVYNMYTYSNVDGTAVKCLKIPTAYENKKLSYCWETVRRESIPRIAEMDVEMTS